MDAIVVPAQVLRPAVSVSRTFDAAAVNAIVNHPAVLPYVSLPGQDSLDVTDIVADQRNIVLACDGGALIGIQLEPCVYEVHSQFIPSARGRKAEEAVRQAVHLMFQHGDAMELLTKVPTSNAPAQGLAVRSGFRLNFERDKVWQARGKTVGLRYYALRYPDYVQHYGDDLAECGEAFHAQLESGKARIGLANDSHPPDNAHDVAVGAAFEMIRAGQVTKGVTLYNRWARFAGYEPVSIVSADPCVINIVDCLVRVTGGSFEVLPCQ